MLSDPALLQYGMHESILTQLSEQYPDDVILLCCDSAAWHTSGGLNLPDNIVLMEGNYAIISSGKGMEDIIMARAAAISFK